MSQAQSKEFVPAAPIYCYVIIAVSGAVASAFESKVRGGPAAFDGAPALLVPRNLLY